MPTEPAASMLRPSRTRHALVAAAALTVAGLLAAPASAQTTTWTGAAGNNNWFDAGNWTNGVPTNADDAVVGAPAPTNINASTTIGGLSVLDDGTLNVGSSINFNFTSGASISNAGQVNVGLNTDFQLLGTVDNSGDFFLTGNSTISDFELVTDTTLVGGGTFTLGGGNARFSDSDGAVLRLTNVDNTIRGSGQIGANSIALTNSGLIDADVTAGQIAIDTVGDGFNTGTLRASAGTLLISGSLFDNTGGTIESAGGQVQLSNSSITGGTLSGGDIFVPNSVNTDLADLTNAGSIFVGLNTDLGVAGTITNNGTITIQGNSTISDVELQTDTALAGTGSLFLDGGNARVSDSLSAATVLTNGPDHTIRGNGQLGANTIDIVNNGLIVADVNAGQMTVDPAGTFTNNSTLRAENGGLLELRGGAFANNGTIEALGTGVVEIDAEARITGGTLDGDGGFVVPASVNAGLINLTNNAAIGVDLNTDLEVTGTIVNNGTITIRGDSSISDLELQADTTLAGSGSVFLNGGNARISDSLGSATVLTNGPDHAVRGNGQLGVNTIDVVNNGLVTADVSGGRMTLDPAGAFTNNNLLRAQNGGILTLGGGAYANGGGSIVADSGSTVEIANGATITGGTLGGDGSFAVLASINAGIANLTNNAAIGVDLNTDLEVTGTITNNGTITVRGDSSISDIELQTDTTLAGSGSLLLNGGNARGERTTSVPSSS